MIRIATERCRAACGRGRRANTSTVSSRAATSHSRASWCFDERAASDGADDGRGAARFVALMRSQGSYQGLLRLGMTDDELGATDFEREVHAAFGESDASPGLSFSWRVRLGVTPTVP